MSVEALLLTGGSSRRMGMPKAQLVVKGVPLGDRIANELHRAGWPVTVLGQEPIAGYGFIKDTREFAGPLAALKQYRQGADLVFIAACDMPLFRREVVKALADALDPESDAILPVIDGELQPLCGIYRKRCFNHLVSDPLMERMSDWIGHLKVQRLETLPFPAEWITPVNTPGDLQALLRRDG